MAKVWIIFLMNFFFIILGIRKFQDLDDILEHGDVLFNKRMGIPRALSMNELANQLKVI